MSGPRSLPRHGSALASVAHVGAAIILSVMTWTSVYAGSVSDTSCVGSRNAFNCRWGRVGDLYVRLVPEPLGETEKAYVMARDRRWRARCRPVIEYDHYGVARYHYSAPGCEFGVGADRGGPDEPE